MAVVETRLCRPSSQAATPASTAQKEARKVRRNAGCIRQGNMELRQCVCPAQHAEFMALGRRLVCPRRSAQSASAARGNALRSSIAACLFSPSKTCMHPRPGWRTKPLHACTCAPAPRHATRLPACKAFMTRARRHRCMPPCRCCGRARVGLGGAGSERDCGNSVGRRPGQGAGNSRRGCSVRIRVPAASTGCCSC